MKYKITIEEEIQVPEQSYPKTKTVYEQTVEDLDVQAVIAVVNGLTK